MAKLQKALLKVAIRTYAYRLAIAFVYVLMAFAVRTTNLQAGIATQFDTFGIKPETTQTLLWFGFTLGGIIVMVVRKWWGDLLIMLPMLAVVYISFQYSIATKNHTAPVAYFVIFFLVGFVLWARRFYESIS